MSRHSPDNEQERYLSKNRSSGVSNFRLALRNTVRNRVRSVMAIAAISFSVIALLLAGGFIQWVFWAMRGAATETGLGHIHVIRPGYLDSGTADPFAYLLPEKSPELSSLQINPRVKVVAPRLRFGGLISHGDATLSFLGEGVDPDKEKVVSRVLPIPVGNNLFAEDPRGIILGEGLAANLGVKPGDNVVLLANTASGGINAIEGHVRGLFSTQVKAYDDAAIRLPIKMAQELLRTGGVHAWIVVLDNVEHLEELLQRFRSEYSAANLQFVPWFDQADFYKKTVALLSSQMNVVRILIGLVIILGISNMLIMNVLERTGEIGTLMAMGSRRRQVLKLFLSEGVLLGLIGGTLGLLIGLGLAYLISAIGIPMPPPPGRSEGYSAEILVTWQLAVGAFALAIGTTVMAGVYPAWKASRLVIVDALRHNR